MNLLGKIKSQIKGAKRVKISLEDESCRDSRTYITTSTLLESTQYQNHLGDEKEDTQNTEDGFDFTRINNKAENKIQLLRASNC